MGRLISRTSFIIFLFGLKSFRDMFVLGINIISSITDDSSLMIFIRTTPVMAMVSEYLRRLGIKYIVRMSLTICSNVFDNTCGSIFSLPKK